MEEEKKVFGEDKTKWGYREVKKENKLLEEYYSKGSVVPPEEVEAFFAALRRPLPTTFRVARNVYLRDLVTKKLEEYSAGVAEKDTLRRLPYYPEGRGWHMNAGRRDLRVDKSLLDIRNFVIAQNETGNLTRQEAVSMLPPLFLDVQSHHRVLDMCAAPGSKTTQLLEILHQNVPRGQLPTGFVVANDIDVDRCFMLVHQTKRVASPNFVVTCHEAEKYPRRSPSGAEFLFDRVLADVPCSGDGTFRKNMDLWKKWTPRMGIRQHTIQIPIARRGAFLLAPGGRMVYSTCSMNPVEDEAVVAQLLRTSNGTLRLVDVSDVLPELKRKNGISDWKIFLGEGLWVNSYAEVPEDQRKWVPETIFPPTKEEAEQFHLERCMRVLPHMQDTGGFFVAVLEKSADAPLLPDPLEPAMMEEAARKKEEAARAEMKPMRPRKMKRGSHAKECDEPMQSMAAFERSAEVIANIKEFYDVAETFPFNALISRNKELTKINLVSPGIHELIKDTKYDETNPCNMRIVHAGLKLFQNQQQKHVVKCFYRVSMEALQYFLPHISAKRIVPATVADLRLLLTEQDPEFAAFPGEQFREEIAKIDCGCYIVNVAEHEGMMLAAWKGVKSTHLLVPKEETTSLKNVLFPELPPPDRSMKQRKRGKKRAEEKAPASPTLTPPPEKSPKAE